MPEVEFFFDYGSPTTYLAYTQLPGIAKRRGARIVYRPILLGGVFKATGNRTPVSIPAKGRWMGRDLERFAKRYGVPMAVNPHFPINTLVHMRGAVAAERLGCLLPYSDAIFRGVWVERKAMQELAVIAEVLNAAGLDAQALFALAEDQSVKDELRTRTDEAVARGVFGAPTFFVGDEMFFGQDRLDFVDEALAERNAAA